MGWAEREEGSPMTRHERQSYGACSRARTVFRFSGLSRWARTAWSLRLVVCLSMSVSAMAVAVMVCRVLYNGVQ